MIKVDYQNDPEEEYLHWCEVYSFAIGISDREIIDELKELLPKLEERF